MIADLFLIFFFLVLSKQLCYKHRDKVGTAYTTAAVRFTVLLSLHSIVQTLITSTALVPEEIIIGQWHPKSIHFPTTFSISLSTARWLEFVHYWCCSTVGVRTTTLKHRFSMVSPLSLIPPKCSLFVFSEKFQKEKIQQFLKTQIMFFDMCFRVLLGFWSYF